MLKTELYGEGFLAPTDMGTGEFFIFDVSKKSFGPWYNAYLYVSYRNADGSLDRAQEHGRHDQPRPGSLPLPLPRRQVPVLHQLPHRTGERTTGWTP